MDRTASSPNGSFAVVLLEFILVEVGAWLGYQVAYGISHAESVMDAMALTAFPNRTMHIHEASRQIKTEITRCRRFHRPLGLLVLQIHADDHIRIKELVGSMRQDLWNRFSFARIGQVIDEQIRQTDMVFRERGGRLVILCPETDQENITILAKRISETVEHRTGIRVDTGYAGFPDDAINFDDLMDTAITRLTHPERYRTTLPEPENIEVRL
jgi:GGDEF domain-containing protein